jgi:integrase
MPIKKRSKKKTQSGPWRSRTLDTRRRPCCTSLRELRDHEMATLFLGCGLRRGEALGLAMESIQQREEHWVFADLAVKGGHIRTVPMPAWVKSAVDTWTRAAGLTHGRVFRAINEAAESGAMA